MANLEVEMADTVSSTLGQKPVQNVLFYPAGFDQDITMLGAMYRTGSRYPELQADGFLYNANNALGLFEGALSNGLEYSPYVFSWESDGDMIAPFNFSYHKGARYRKGAGFYSGRYIDKLIGEQSVVRGIVLQNLDPDQDDLLYGHAVNNRLGVTVRHAVIPNTTGAVAPSDYVSSISPTSKHFANINGQSPGGVYSIRIDISPNNPVQDWGVNIPTDVSWVRAEVTSGSGTADIVITVDENRSFYNRETIIQVGGFNHRITQERRTSD